MYASEAAAQGWDIQGVLNCDMMSYAITTNDGNNLDVYQDSQSEWLYTYTMGVNSEYSEYIGPLALHDAGLSGGSDHYYFWQNGYSALFYFEYTMNPYYHSPQDTIENINLTYAVKNTKLILATLAELAEAGLLSESTINTPVINEQYTYTAVSTEPDGEMSTTSLTGVTAPTVDGLVPTTLEYQPQHRNHGRTQEITRSELKLETSTLSPADGLHQSW